MHYAPWVIEGGRFEIYWKSPKSIQFPPCYDFELALQFYPFLEIWNCVHHHHHNVVPYGVQVIYFVIRNTPSRPICNPPKSSSPSTSSWSSAIKHIMDSSKPLCKYSFSEFSAHPIGNTAHEYCHHCNHPTTTWNTSSQDIWCSRGFWCQFLEKTQKKKRNEKSYQRSNQRCTRVTRPERSKGANDEVKQTRRAAN